LILLLILSPSIVLGAANFGLYSLTFGTPNMLSIFSGDSNGMITYVSQVSTQGNGVPSTGPGLQSQHSIVVYNNYIFAVNPSSNTLSMFGISSADPTSVTLLGTPQPTGGDWPLSVSASGNTACVVNSGATNGLRCFSFSSAGLSVIAGSDRFFNLNLTTPPVSHTGPAQISFSPDGNSLLVSVKSQPPMMVYSISSSGVPGMTPAVASNKGNVPFGFAFDIDGTVVLTDPAPTGSYGGLMLLTVSNTPSVTYDLSQYFLLTGEYSACWCAMSTQTTHFYAANAASYSISEVSRSGDTLTLVNNIILGNTSKPLDLWIANINGQDYLYQFCGGSEQIAVVKLISGASVVVQTVATQGGAYGSGVTVYVVPPATSTTGEGNTLSIYFASLFSLIVLALGFL